MPKNLVRRFLDPYGLYRKYISDDVEPFLALDGVAIAGVKTTRRARLDLDWKNGSISRDQLAALREKFAAADPAAIRVVVAHHPLLEPEAQTEHAVERVHRADRALETFSALGVRLVLSGHFHLSYVRKHERPGTVTEGEPRGPREAAVAPILVAQASSVISTRLRGEPNSYNLIDIADGEITISVREWRDGAWLTREQAKADAEPPATAAIDR